MASKQMGLNGGDGDKSGDKFDEKKNVLTDKLLKREEERQENVLKRKEEKEKRSAAEENAEHFTVNFSREKKDLEVQIEKCGLLRKQDIAGHFDELSRRMQSLQKFLADATIFLPSYEVRHAQESLNNLQQTIQTKREDLLPKKKFAFKIKKKIIDKPKQAEGKDETDMPNNDSDDMNIELAECKFADRKDETLEKVGSDINQKDVALARLTDCCVILKGSPSAMHVKHLFNCKVFCGPVGGSIFISDCSNCVFLLPCQQLRIHTTTDTQFYIHVTSRAIIEDTSKVSFAPYNWGYTDIDAHYAISGLDKARNNWDDIDDFNWLASDKHSPNWSIMSENDRVKTWDI